MKRQLPPFPAARAFEAAARHGSFKKAAEELCLSPSAVSHQIRALETYLDTMLFERVGNEMRLTLTGQAYAGRLTGLLDQMDHATRVAKEGVQRPFRVLCTPGFAARWLVPRLGSLDFGDKVRLQVSVGAPSTDFATNDSDVVIQWSTDPTPGVVVEPFMESSRYPIIAPSLRRKSKISEPSDLLRLSLIRDETDDSWAEWFSQAGLGEPKMPPGPTYPNCELATTAVEQGQGVSLAYDSVVRGTLESGRVERLFRTVTLPVTIYSLAYQQHRADDQQIAAFREWLFDHARKFFPSGVPLSATA